MDDLCGVCYHFQSSALSGCWRLLEWTSTQMQAGLWRTWKTGNCLALSPCLVDTSVYFFWWHIHNFSCANIFESSPPSGTSQPSPEFLLPSLTTFCIKITAAKNVLYGLGAPLCMKNVCRSQDPPGVSSRLFPRRMRSDTGKGHDLAVLPSLTSSVHLGRGKIALCELPP